ncbi:restriction endonuclease subunit S [Globicatella sp. PHS-GS-PNBC-21-1553]|uniref:restriction endonuclease subunit S n=1 Tax=Globicatella sp. PHS-GS-PNBC-21-1553 TaxID=2885764 RepID=UPI00298EE0D8|nr:restriction endonuclease subunit S [Globicatella sp. PHS-GS-PNBC-21-1553]WPC07723.1 restriction endonuclease subunit S [Globicatella sp. PHS-GS-PNBC-21-1553]
MPYVDKYDVAYSEVEKLNKKFPEDMQKSILQYAIQGKLVEQREEDGTAEDLYKQIQVEKKKLIKEGKIKKTKTLPEITEDEIPFDIPENWKWVRLGNIVSVLGDGIHGTPVYDDRGSYYFINGNNLNNGVIEIKDNTKKVDEEQFLKHKRELNDNTVLVSINGTIGNVAFYAGEKVILGKSACYFNLINEDFKYYLYWVIKTKYFLDYAIKKATGTTIKNVSLATMKELVVPLPPLAEQKRIVEKIEEMLPYIKQLVKNVD